MVQNKASMLPNTPSMVQNKASMVQNRASMLRNRASMLQNEASMVQNRASMVRNEASMVRNEASMVRNEASMVENEASMVQSEARILQCGRQDGSGTCGSRLVLAPPTAYFAKLWSARGRATALGGRRNRCDSQRAMLALYVRCECHLPGKHRTLREVSVPPPSQSGGSARTPKCCARKRRDSDATYVTRDGAVGGRDDDRLWIRHPLCLIEDV
jgi:hypothetical protein